MDARRATVADAAALTRMRALMLEAMGADVGAPDAPWRKAAEDWFAEQLARTDTFAAFVVDDPDLGVVCSAAGICDRHAPGPANLDGLSGHVFNVSTDPRRRRRGLARLCVTALLGWFREESGVAAVGLHATGDGEALYRSVGFAEPRFPELKLRLT
ncbi:GNAT family N-acetyltransferase [Fodinicola acaciae]|uniref:GNAT family N-acetyltransferase n=1 Tax=Fodinicola acaciae TaxID=2681555 RepID=UPI0013D4487C|nr:GNAT family N-acetyltransferase [Fodinicola acaciae]